MQAAPRQSAIRLSRIYRLTNDAPRAGSAEAKSRRAEDAVRRAAMHPVQAAPRQRPGISHSSGNRHDAPRAGSAEAKRKSQLRYYVNARCTPCRQRRGKVTDNRQQPILAIGCTPCRQRRGKVRITDTAQRGSADAPRAGSAEAKVSSMMLIPSPVRCTPCRQRRGKGPVSSARQTPPEMHPVQAAPRQRLLRGTKQFHQVQDAPRAGSADAKSCMVCRQAATIDAPRAGSAEAKEQIMREYGYSSRMHPVQAVHSEITTCRPMVL